MSAPTRVDLDRLLCARCWYSPLLRHCTCFPAHPEALAKTVRKRHEISILKAAYRAEGYAPGSVR